MRPARDWDEVHEILARPERRELRRMRPERAEKGARRANRRAVQRSKFHHNLKG